MAEKRNGKCTTGSMPSAEVLKDYMTKKLDQISNKVITDTVNTKKEVTKIGKLVDDVKDTVAYCCEQYDSMAKTLEDNTETVIALKKENKTLQDSLSKIIYRLDMMESQARQSNVVVHNVPELKNEDSSRMMHIIRAISETVQACLTPQDVVDFYRFPKVAQDNRTRSIVVKLASPRVRERFIKAVDTYNKENPKQMLSTEHLGLAVVKQNIRVNRHQPPRMDV